jgi:hypothetical protein
VTQQSEVSGFRGNHNAAPMELIFANNRNNDASSIALHNPVALAKIILDI